MYRAITRGIEVKVTPRFLPERSSPENGYYFWAYSIEIVNHGKETVQLRTRVGMVFQKPNPFPKSIYENVAYGPRIHWLARNRAELDEIVRTSLRRA